LISRLILFKPPKPDDAYLFLPDNHLFRCSVPGPCPAESFRQPQSLSPREPDGYSAGAYVSGFHPDTTKTLSGESRLNSRCKKFLSASFNNRQSKVCHTR